MTWDMSAWTISPTDLAALFSEYAMPFYATCPYCKIPSLVEDEYRERACACSSCGKLFQPADQTAIQTYSAPPPILPKPERPAWQDERVQSRPYRVHDDYED